MQLHSRPWFIVSLLALAGCAEFSKAPPHLFDKLQVQTQTACCASVSEALSRSEFRVASGQVFRFTPSSPHFDFGQGLAPFVSAELEPGARVLEIEAGLDLLGTFRGGDGLPKYVDLHAYFFDTRGAALSAQQLDHDERFTGPGARALFKYVTVPAGASRLVIAANPLSAGRYTMTSIKALPSHRLTSTSKAFFAFNGLIGGGWYGQAYGHARFRALPNE